MPKSQQYASRIHTAKKNEEKNKIAEQNERGGETES